MLSKTDTLIYADPEAEYHVMLERVTERGIKKTARDTGISARHLSEAVNGKSRLRAPTTAKLRAIFT